MSIDDSLAAVIVASDASSLEALQRLSKTVEGLRVSATQVGAVRDAEKLLRAEDPDLLLIAATPLEIEQARSFLSLSAAHPAVDLVLFVPELNSASLQGALRVGAREVIALNGTSADIQGAVSRIRFRKEATRTRQGRMITFASCKGGSGSTFVCANLGYAMAAMSDQRILLIDLNLQFGDAALYLTDARPTSTVADVAADVQRLDAALLKASTLQILPNYSLLPAPLDPASAAGVQPQQIGDLLRFARTQADVVLLDLGRKLDAGTLEALDLSNSIFLVLQQTLPYLRDARRMIEMFRGLGYSSEKVKAVVNRFDRHADISLEDLEDALSSSMYASLPNDYKVASASVNQGIPVHRLAPTSALARGFGDFAVKLGAARPTDLSWFQRVLKRA
jgi:pilus assembly protein CpaE